MRSIRSAAVSSLWLLLAAQGAGAAEFCVSADAGAPGRTHGTIALAIGAARVNAEPDVIRVVSGAVGAGQTLVIDRDDVTLRGGYADCVEALPSSGRTVVSGAGANAPVLTIFGPADVRLERLEIAGGAALNGGGIVFNGSAVAGRTNRLTLSGTQVANNVAQNSGGGLYVQAGGNDDGQLVEVVLEEDTHIDDNRAGADGGGLSMVGRVHLRAQANILTFHRNEAINGRGGAIYMRQPASADIGSAPLIDGATFLRNRAGTDGGAIFVDAPGNVPRITLLNLYGFAPDLPLVLQANEALVNGGALAVAGLPGPFQGAAPAIVCAYNVNLVGNRATDGAAMSLFNSLYSTTCEGRPRPGGAMPPCTPRSACNRIENNRNLGTGSLGVIRLHSTYLGLEHATLKSNHSGMALLHVGRGSGDHSDVDLRDSLIVDNQLSDANAGLIRAEFGTSQIDIRTSTIAGNQWTTPGGNARVFYLTGAIGRFWLSNSIAYQPGTKLLESGGTADVLANTLVVHELPDPTKPELIIVGDPRFVGGGDYRLRRGSPAIDFAGRASFDSVDLDSNPRGGNDPRTPNLYGPDDLGAYEFQPMDIFAGGFEDS